MRVLLDTHAFLWFIGGSAELSSDARSTIEAADNEKLVSLASAWELSIKSSSGKLILADPFETFLPEQLQLNGFGLLGITLEHIAQVHSLPFHHRDPFDRMIIAQALVDDIAVVSNDAEFDAYGVERIW